MRWMPARSVAASQQGDLVVAGMQQIAARAILFYVILGSTRTQYWLILMVRRTQSSFEEPHMKSTFFRMICRLLIASLIVLPFQATQAGVIGTSQAAAASSAQADRAAVLAVMSRTDRKSVV